MRAALFSVLALAACAATPAPDSSPAQGGAALAAQIRADNQRLDADLHASGVVSAAIGETADLGGGLTVKPLEVIEDSRCPSNVTCVWAGRLRLRAEVSGVAHELTLGEPLQTSNGTVTLAVVSPGAWSQWPGGKPPYRFGFRKS